MRGIGRRDFRTTINITSGQVKYLEHITRHTGSERAVMEGTAPGRWARARPRLRWTPEIKATLTMAVGEHWPQINSLSCKLCRKWLPSKHRLQAGDNQVAVVSVVLEHEQQQEPAACACSSIQGWELLTGQIIVVFTEEASILWTNTRQTVFVGTESQNKATMLYNKKKIHPVFIK